MYDDRYDPTISFRLSKFDNDRLMRLAEKRDETRSDLIRFAVRNFLDNIEKSKTKTMKALKKYKYEWEL